MLAPLGRRPYVLVLVISFVLVILLLLHHNSDYIPFPPQRPIALDSPRLDLPQLDSLCSAPDPFEVEYGRTNIRLTRAYEGTL